MEQERCPDCKSNDLLFKALVNSNGKFEEFYDDGENNEVFCQQCNDWKITEPI